MSRNGCRFKPPSGTRRTPVREGCYRDAGFSARSSLLRDLQQSGPIHQNSLYPHQGEENGPIHLPTGSDFMQTVRPEERVFVYVRLTAGGREFARSKVRELAGLPGALADMMGTLFRERGSLPREGTRFEFIEADSEKILISLSTDAGRKEYVIAGRIPDRCRKRVLEEPPEVNLAHFEERAARELDDSSRDDLHELLRHPRLDILALIRSHIREDGSFEIRLPIPSAPPPPV